MAFKCNKKKMKCKHYQSSWVKFNKIQHKAVEAVQFILILSSFSDTPCRIQQYVQYTGTYNVCCPVLCITLFVFPLLFSLWSILITLYTLSLNSQGTLFKVSMNTEVITFSKNIFRNSPTEKSCYCDPDSVVGSNSLSTSFAVLLLSF